MKAKDLIAHLNNFDPEMYVYFAYASGTFWLSSSVEGVCKDHVTYSWKHDSARLCESPAERESFAKEVIVLMP